MPSKPKSESTYKIAWGGGLQMQVQVYIPRTLGQNKLGIRTQHVLNLQYILAHVVSERLIRSGSIQNMMDMVARSRLPVP